MLLGHAFHSNEIIFTPIKSGYLGRKEDGCISWPDGLIVLFSFSSLLKSKPEFYYKFQSCNFIAVS